jgi:rubrerythrin
MSDTKAMEILKSAILLERKGRALYTTVAQQTESAAARDFFQHMAEEEEEHCRWLEEQFKSYSTHGKFAPNRYDSVDSSVSHEILTAKLKEEISAAGYEAAAIGAAIALEEQAIRIYGQRAEATNDPHERAIYAALVAFEKEHLEKLVGVNREITESVWNDNQFWPF